MIDPEPAMTLLARACRFALHHPRQACSDGLACAMACALIAAFLVIGGGP